MSSTEDRIAAGAAARVALDRGNPEPTPAADEREALAATVRGIFNDPKYGHDPGWLRINVLGAINRSQPAPRTVSAEEVQKATRTKRMDDIAQDTGVTPDWLIEQVLAALNIEVTR